MRDRIETALQADGGRGCKGRGKSGWGRGHGRYKGGAESGAGKPTLPLGVTPATA